MYGIAREKGQERRGNGFDREVYTAAMRRGNRWKAGIVRTNSFNAIKTASRSLRSTERAPLCLKRMPSRVCAPGGGAPGCMFVGKHNDIRYTANQAGTFAFMACLPICACQPDSATPAG